jgi:hypothetical protein
MEASTCVTDDSAPPELLHDRRREFGREARPLDEHPNVVIRHDDERENCRQVVRRRPGRE